MLKQIDLNSTRLIAVFRVDVWEPVPSLTLVRAGERFRMFEPDTREPVVLPATGRTEFIAAGDGYSAEGVGTILIETD